MLAQGDRGGVGVEPVPPTLTALPADGKPARTFTVGSRFNALAQSGDGQFAVLHFVQGAKAASDDVLFNPNEIAVIDLDKPEAMAVTPRTLRSFGSAPLEVVFSPPLTVSGRKLRLAVALSEGYVTLFDLERVGAAEASVPLTLNLNDTRRIRPVQVLFEQKDPTGSDAVRAHRRRERRLRHPPARPWRKWTGRNDFAPVLSLLAAGNVPVTWRCSTGPTGRPPAGGRVGQQGGHRHRSAHQPGHVHPARGSGVADPALRGTSPSDPKVRPRALLFSPGGAAQVAFLDLDQVEDLRTRNLDSRPMSATAESIVPLLEQGLVAVRHGSLGGGA